MSMFIRETHCREHKNVYVEDKLLPRSHTKMKIRSEAGMAYITILFLLIIISSLGLAFLQKVGIGTAAIAARGSGMQAQYLAESAVNHAMWRLLNESDFPEEDDEYYMHSLSGGRYGYKVRRHTNTTFATVATVGAVGKNVVYQSYVLYISGWYDSKWRYRQKITISDNVTDTDLTNFPYAIIISDPANDLFMNSQVDGEDILFTDSKHTTKLDHEIEKYESFDGNEEWVAWVKIPLLSSTDPTEIYMYYGNSGVTTQENVTGVWSNGYEAVYHQHDDFLDSLGNHNGTNTNSADVTGPMADAQDFYPANGVDRIDLGNWSVSGSQLTIQAWIYSDDGYAQRWPRVITKATGTATEDHVWMMSLYPGTGSRHNRLRFRLKTGSNDSAGTTTLYGSNPDGYLTSTSWFLAAMTYDGNQMQIIRDGRDAGSVSKNGDMRENAWPVNIGTSSPGGGSTTASSWDGKIDEVRVSTVARSIDWIEAEYRNQGSPGTYESLGAEEDVRTYPTVILAANFDTDSEGFAYGDDTFRGTWEPVYAEGKYLASGGYAGGALGINLGGIDNSDRTGMSGGWQKTFNLAADSEILISFIYKMTLAANYESNEYGQVLVSVDGTLYGEGAGDYILQINGDGNGGSNDITGWHRFSMEVGTLSAGNHTIIIGVYNNLKTYNDESVDLLIDNVMITK